VTDWPLYATDLATSDAFAAALATARLAWPTVELSAEAFARALAQRARTRHPSSPDEIAAALVRIHAADVYLVEACVRGDSRACVAFTEVVRRVIAGPVGAILGTSLAIDDVRQLVCQRLLVTVDGALRIASYTGEVSLAAWVRVIATRIAIDERRKRSGERPLEDTLVESLQADCVSPELGELKSKYSDRFKAAVEAAVTTLSERDRSVLRFTIEHGLTADEIGRIFDVHRVTIARWLRRIRDALSAQILQALGVSPEELASMLGLIKGQISLSIERLLEPAT
jgi:RNA polymerase sigma-70 factor (ECF subfamily)